MGALDGIRVVDLTWNLPGPYASAQLAAFGAEVLKVEPPKGDPARHMPGLFETLNHAKRSIRLDLRDPAGQAALHAELATADVVLEGFRPGVAERLGCGPAETVARYPRVVYCSISAYGRQGPHAGVPAHDLNVQAWSGLAWLGRDRRDRPHGLALPVTDYGAAMAATTAILAALLAREKDGRGAVLDVAMVDAAVSFAGTWSRVDPAADAARALPRGLRRLAGPLLRRLDRQRLHAFPHYDTYRCGDGKWLAIGIVDERHFWEALCAGLGLGRLAALPLPARAVAGPALRRLVAARLRAAPRDTWLERLRGVPVSPVLTPEEALAEPAWRARRTDPAGRLSPPVTDPRSTEPPAAR